MTKTIVPVYIYSYNLPSYLLWNIGGYHPVSVGDVFHNRYTVIRKLGWGHFSTVWLSWDAQRNTFVALKIVKSAEHYTEAAEDEILLLERVNQSIISSRLTPDQETVVRILDHFRHRGPHGMHVCMVFEVLGENLLKIIRRFEHRGLPIAVVKTITRQMLEGLDLLHRRCGIIHTDLKPENVLVCLEAEEIRRIALMALERAIREGGDFLIEREQTSGSRGSFAEHLYRLASSPDDLTASQERMRRLYEQTAITCTDDIIDSVEGMNLSPRVVSNVVSSLQATQSGGLFIRGTDHSASLPTTTTTTPAMAEITPSASQASQSMEMTSSNEYLGQINNTRSVKRNDITSSRSQSRGRKLPLEKIRVKIADLGNACWVDRHFTNDIQTRQYRAPEVILGMKYDTSCDIWSAACLIFELLTGDFLFAPHSGKRYNKNEDHIAQMIELLGKIPRSFALGGKYSYEIFNRRGELRHIRDLEYWKLEDVLVEKYSIPKEEAIEIADFLLPMLEYVPKRRATAQECLRHCWLATSDKQYHRSLPNPQHNGRSRSPSSSSVATLNRHSHNNNNSTK